MIIKNIMLRSPFYHFNSPILDNLFKNKIQIAKLKIYLNLNICIA
jgi:hypothetical protein